MNIQEYSERFQSSKGKPLARVILFIESLPLRFRIWNTIRIMNNERRKAG